MVYLSVPLLTSTWRRAQAYRSRERSDAVERRPQRGVAGALEGGRVARAGDVDLGGTLRFRFRNGMTPAAFPAVYPVLSGHRLTGDFDALDLPQPVVPGSAVYVGHDGTTVSVAFTCPADNAVPFGVLDLADITGFVSAFLAHEPPADLAEPLGVFDLGDITAFISGFTGGCP